MQTFINQTREKVETGRGAEELDKEALKSALAIDK